MRHCRLALALLVMQPFLHAQEAKPILVLNTGGHHAPIPRVLFTPDGQSLITVSEDRTVRVWDVESGETIQVFRTPIGPTGRGRLNAGAVSPDGKTLAVGGHAQNKDGYPVFLIDLEEGRIKKTLTKHDKPITSLAFSPDGKRLASGSVDHNACVWLVAGGTCEHKLKGHTERITDLAFSPKGDRLATGSLDATVRFWSVKTGKEMKNNVLSGNQQPPVHCLAFSRDGKTVVTAGEERFIYVWDENGTYRKSREALDVNDRGKVIIHGLDFAADPNEVVVFWQHESEAKSETCDRGANFVPIKSGKYRESLKRSNYLNPMHGALSPDKKLVAMSGNGDHKIYLWRADNPRRMRHLGGKGQTPFNAGWKPDGHAIAWANLPSTGELIPGNAPLQRAFDLTRLRFAARPDSKTYQQARLSGNGLKLNHKLRSNTVEVRDSKAVVSTLIMNFNVSHLTLLGDDRLALGGARDGNEVMKMTTLGGVGYLHLVDARTKKTLIEFKGYNGRLRALASSADGRFLLAAHADQVMRVWDTQGEKPSPYPLLSLFVAGNDWIVWTPEGYYAASPGGERLLGWYIDNGPEKLGTFYSAAQFHKSLYRPDVILRIMKEHTVSRAVELADSARGVNKSAPVQVARVLPPKVGITLPPKSRLEVEEAKLEIQAVARPGGQAEVASLQLLLDDRPYQGEKGIVKKEKFKRSKEEEVSASWTVELPPGTHSFRVLAQSAVSSATSRAVEVTYKPRVQPVKIAGPGLVVLAIGINNYPGSLKLNWATKDAQDVEKMFKEKARPPFGQIKTKLLTDKEASQKGILAGLDWLREQMTPQDTAVIFYAGHGHQDTQTGQFYMVSQDVDLKRLAETVVKGDDIKKKLAEVPGKVLVLLDACHSGAIGQRRPGEGSLTDSLRRELTADDCGVVVMCAAMSAEEAGESPDVKHGYFTRAVLQGLAGQARPNRQGLIHLTGLHAYVEEQVEILSKDEQHAVIDRPTSVRSFPLTKP